MAPRPRRRAPTSRAGRGRCTRGASAADCHPAAVRSARCCDWWGGWGPALPLCSRAVTGHSGRGAAGGGLGLAAADGPQRQLAQVRVAQRQGAAVKLGVGEGLALRPGMLGDLAAVLGEVAGLCTLAVRAGGGFLGPAELGGAAVLQGSFSGWLGHGGWPFAAEPWSGFTLRGLPTPPAFVRLAPVRWRVPTRDLDSARAGSVRVRRATA